MSSIVRLFSRSRQTRVRVLLSVVATLAVVAAPTTVHAAAPTAPASKPPTVQPLTAQLIDVVELKNWHDGKCLDMTYKSSGGWYFKQQPCNYYNTQLFHRYKSTYRPTDQYGNLLPELGQAFKNDARQDVCLADGDGAGGYVPKGELWAIYCVPPGALGPINEDDHRLWWRVGKKKIDPNTDPDTPYWQFINYHTGLCLTEQDDIKYGNYVIEQKCADFTAQYWHPY